MTPSALRLSLLALGLASLVGVGPMGAARAAAPSAPSPGGPAAAGPASVAPPASALPPAEKGAGATSRAPATDEGNEGRQDHEGKDPVPTVIRVHFPRDTGRHLGDLVTYRVLMAWPAGWEIDRDGLPTPIRDDAPVELRSHTITPASDQCSDCRWLDLHWQVFKAVRMTEDVPLPAVAMRLRHGSRITTVDLPPTVLAVSPLVPWERRRDWLDSARPGWGPFLLDSRRPALQALAAAGVALLALLGWAWASGRWFTSRQARPFAAAWRSVRSRHRRGDSDYADLDDLRDWHRAFDATAGETVLPGRLDAFFEAEPRFASLAAEVRAVFEASQRLFFTEASAPSARLPLPTLVDTLRHLADAEFRPLSQARAGRQPLSRGQDAAV